MISDGSRNLNIGLPFINFLLSPSPPEKRYLDFVLAKIYFPHLTLNVPKIVAQSIKPIKIKIELACAVSLTEQIRQMPCLPVLNFLKKMT